MKANCGRRADPVVPEFARRHRPARWLALLLACGLLGEARCDVAAQAAEPGASWAVEFPELIEACRPIGQFVVDNTIQVGEGRPIGPFDPIPAQARVLAFEENGHFLCATADVSDAVRGPTSAEDASDQPTCIRRLLLLKPSTFVIDDFVRPAAPTDRVRSRLRCQKAPTVMGRRLSIEDGGRQLVCTTLWPKSATPRKVSPPAGSSDAVYQAVYQVEAKPKDGTGVVRMVYVLQLRPAGDDRAGDESVLSEKDGCLELKITTADRVYRLSLPSPEVDAGRITIDGADGSSLVARRPLPSGVLPHGPDGMALVERWDRAYRDGQQAPWDSGVPAADLKGAVENGDIRPCRTVVLGCGSGTNAIYLAGKGFDVTAIDVAPTALGIAQTKAEKAGVSVRWMLADVLAPPDLEPFELIFDRGCYHNVRYVDAARFVESSRRLSRPGTQFLILSLNRDGPPGVREHHMREDFSSLFDFVWLRESGIVVRQDQASRPSWSAMLRRREAK